MTASSAARVTAATHYRQATVADLNACADVLYAADDELAARRGLPVSPRNREPLVRLFAHLLAGQPDRYWVAEHAGRVLGFGASVQYQDMTYLGFLFVEPELQAAGVGRELLERSMHDSRYRAVCIASYQPISAALYARYGMVPRIPIYMLTGSLRRALRPLPRGLDVRMIAAEDADGLDVAICGVSRPTDHAFWSTMGRVRYGLFERHELVGYGYVQAAGRLGPFVVGRPEHLLPFVGRLIEEMPSVETWMVNVPGPAAETFVALLDAGMRLEGPPAIFCATDLRVDHSRYLPASYALP
jgi:GNAT superfamily N-acetyltransferase